MTVAHVGVVVPAHDEERLLGRCLRSVAAACREAGVPATVVVVLDDCDDDSAVHVPPGMSTLEVAYRNVGRARAAGCAHLLTASAIPPERLWLATTDADSVVRPQWLRRQLVHAAAGYRAVAGTVTVEDWREHSPRVAAAFGRAYRTRRNHGQVHGANLGVLASAYLGVGGFPPLGIGEDQALVDGLRDAAAPVAFAADLPVLTSGRRTGRCPGGFADHLAGLCAKAS